MRRTFPRLTAVAATATVIDDFNPAEATARLFNMLNRTPLLSAPLIGPLPPPDPSGSGPNPNNWQRLGIAAALITPLMFLGEKALANRQKAQQETQMCPGIRI